MHIITINVPVVYMVRNVMILMRENPGHWKGYALKIETFWALNWQRAKRGEEGEPLYPTHPTLFPEAVKVPLR
jgi:hypothetical protein